MHVQYFKNLTFWAARQCKRIFELISKNFLQKSLWSLWISFLTLHKPLKGGPTFSDLPYICTFASLVLSTDVLISFFPYFVSNIKERCYRVIEIRRLYKISNLWINSKIGRHTLNTKSLYSALQILITKWSKQDIAFEHIIGGCVL